MISVKLGVDLQIASVHVEETVVSTLDFPESQSRLNTSGNHSGVSHTAA